MAKQNSIEDIVGAAHVSGNDNSIYRPSTLGKVGKAVRNGFLVALMGLSYILTACDSPVSAATSTQLPTSKPAATATATQKPTATYTETPTATYTTSPTVTPELFTISFQAFHDYNGNGTMDEGEPALEGIVNKTSAGECTTGLDGTCEIVGVPAGDYKIAVTDNRDVKAFEKMRYILPSVSEVRNISQGLGVVVGMDIAVEEPFTSGVLKLPFNEDIKLIVHSYFDLDSAKGKIRNYLGNTKIGCVGDLWTNINVTCDNHSGVDFVLPANTEIQNASIYPGIVEFAEYRNGIGNIILIDHSSFGLDYKTEYAHLKDIIVKKGDIISNGQIIGHAMGNTDTHFGFYEIGAASGGYDLPVDPFRDTLTQSSLGYWVIDNQPFGQTH
jgi:hypothetical protein